MTKVTSVRTATSGMKFKMDGKVYDVLKFIAQIVLPALATCYFGLAQIWGLPYAEQIIGTISVVDAFLGAVLGISTYYYRKDENVANG